MRDAQNQTVTSATNAITLTIGPGSSSGSLGGSTTVSAVNGVATFTDLTVSSDGSFTVVATTRRVTSATSPPFTIAAFVASDGLGHLDGSVMNFDRFGANDLPEELGFYSPTAVAVDPDLHRLWVADEENDRVLLFALSNTDDLTGQALAAANVLGADDFTVFRLVNPPARDRMVSPGGLACDVVGRRLFVADTANSRVLVFDVSSVTDGMDATHVLGQQDFTTVVSDTDLDSLSGPTGLAYDPTTCLLFVADTLHDRVLVFDVSTITNGESAVHSIGQASGGTVTATTLDLNLAFPDEGPTGVAVDPGSRLFVSDPGAHRVLAFDISAGVSTGMAATVALGQPDLVSGTQPSVPGGSFNRAAGLWHDGTADELFVVDRVLSRVLVFDTSSLATGDAAVHVLGQADFTTFDAVTTRSGLRTPEAAAGADGRLFVADTQNHRVLSFDTTTLVDGEDAAGGLGHVDAGAMDFTRGEIGDAPFADALHQPADVLLDPSGHRLFVVDSFNHRVLVFELSPANDFAGVDRVADVVLGQTSFKGREPSRADAGLIDPRGLALAGGRLFVADTSNHRVVIYDATALTTGATPIALLGVPGGNAGDGAAGMYNPCDVDVDAAGDRLFVSDESNDRVLVFEGASTLVTGDGAEHVLGQAGFDIAVVGSGSAGLDRPRAVAHDAVTNRLFVADSYNRRVVVFDVASVTDGQAAVAVLGQVDLTTSSFPTFGDPRGLTFPIALGFDEPRRRLFVGGAGQGTLVAIFDIMTVTSGEAATSFIGTPSFGGPTGIVGPSGIAVDEATGRVFISDAANNRVLRFDLP